MSILEEIKNKQIELINTIKLLIYKENPSLLEKVDFDDDNVFLEPLLFAYFNSRKENLFPNEVLAEIMQGHFIEKETVKIEYSYNSNNIAYIPELGYFKKGETEPIELTTIIENTSIEALKYPIKLLSNIFKTTNGVAIPESEIIIDHTLFENNINVLTNAFVLIKQNSPAQNELIEQCCKKVLMFKTNPENSNSFATINAQGIAFLNVYQDGYDEVFFVDDIAHQTGHIILTTLLHDRKAFFKIDENQYVEEIIKVKDHRNIYTLLHALYTFYASLLCLDDCLNNNSFNDKQEKEAIGRIGFYINKSTSDLERFEKINMYFGGIENVLTKDGIEVYNLIKNKCVEVSKKWNSITTFLDYSNQPYNFTFKNFVELNK